MLVGRWTGDARQGRVSAVSYSMYSTTHKVSTVLVHYMCFATSVVELVREDTPPAHYEIGHLWYKTYALHVTVLWVNAQTVRIPVACLEIVGGVTLMGTYVLASDTNANYLARARFDVLAFARSCVCAFLRLCMHLHVLAFVHAFARSCVCACVCTSGTW
jgi:hypothetical protein